MFTDLEWWDQSSPDAKRQHQNDSVHSARHGLLSQHTLQATLSEEKGEKNPMTYEYYYMKYAHFLMTNQS